MRLICDQLLILGYGLIIGCSVQVNAELVIGLLLALIYLSAVTLIATPYPHWHVLIALSLILCSILIPSCLFFSPLIFYQFDPKKQLGLLLVTFVLLGVIAKQSHLITFVTTDAFLLFGIIGAVYTRYQTRQIEALASRLQQTRDDGVELTLLLQEKNRSLRDKQDDEIYTATLKERNRIAREIHDNVGHLLSRAILMTGAIKLTNETEQLKAPLAHLDESLGEAMTSIRKSVHDLHDDAIDLEKALTELIDGFSFCQVNFSYQLTPFLPKAVKYNVIAIVKEALNNVMKHSQAQMVNISISESAALYQVIISDNGQGKTTADSPDNHGIGLLNMTERVKKLKGSISFYQSNGFSIVIKIPKM